MDKTSISLQDAINKENPPAELISLRSENAQLKSTIRKIKKEAGDLYRHFDALNQSLTTATPLPIVYQPDQSGKSNVWAMLHVTDWHTGEVVDKMEVDDFNEYDPDIQQGYIHQLVKSFIKWTNLNRNSYDLNKLVIPVTGDMISGDIHQELQVNAAYPVPEQQVQAARMFAELVGSLAPHFEQVIVHYVVPDNHSRRTYKLQYKKAGMNSDNYLVGYMSKLFLAEHENVEFNLHLPIMKIIDVNGYRYLASHGDRVFGWAGFPYYGIDRMVAREAKRRLRQPEEKHFDRILIGHWHAEARVQYWSIGSALSGTNEYDHGQGRHAPPGQNACLVHHKRGEFGHVCFNPSQR